jgi:O-methyltransferase domain/Dimerisation domain
MNITKSDTLPPAQVSQAQNSSPQVMVLQMMNAYRLSQNISVAAQLGIADCLETGPKGVIELAEKTSTHAQSLYRLLRALASFGIFEEVDNQQFQLTPRAALLQSNSPGSLRGYAAVIGAKWHWQMWKNILHSVKTGESAFEAIYGMDFEDYYQQNPDVAETFDAAMKGALSLTDRAIVSGYDFSKFSQIVDVAAGGQGDGELIASILQQNQALLGIHFDTPVRIERAAAAVDRAGVRDRCTLLGGDFFESIPSGDAYIVKNLIHDYDDAKSGKILENLYRAMTKTGVSKLLVVEMLVPLGNEPSLAKILDVEALIMTPGAIERTADQYCELLEKSGFKVSNIMPTKSPMSIIEAEPV